MLFRKYLSERDNANDEIRFMRIIVAGLVLVIFVGTVTVLRLLGSEKTVVTPPEIQRSFWVSGSAVSKEYLEEMAYWYAGLALDVTPTVADYQNGLFLKYAAPSEAGRLQADMGARADFLKKNNTATLFSVRNVTTDERNQRVALSGTLYTYVGDKKGGERNATYMVGFKYLNGRLYVSDFRETSDQAPFGSTQENK